MSDTFDRLNKAAGYNTGYALADACKEIDALAAEVVELRKTVTAREHTIRELQKHHQDQVEKLRRQLAEANIKIASYPLSYIHDLEWQKAKCATENTALVVALAKANEDAEQAERIIRLMWLGKYGAEGKDFDPVAAMIEIDLEVEYSGSKSFDDLIDRMTKAYFAAHRTRVEAK
jgi:hypothetical protein